MPSLVHAAFLESLPDTVILGIQPEDTSTLRLRLSETVRARLEVLVSAGLQEIARAGGGYHPRSSYALFSGAVGQFS